MGRSQSNPSYDPPHPAVKISIFLPFVSYFRADVNAYERRYSNFNIIYYPVDALWGCLRLAHCSLAVVEQLEESDPGNN